MARYTFVHENGAWVFNSRSDVEVLALGVVSGNEVKTARVFVIDAGRVHKTTRTGWLEGFRKLPDIKRTEVIRNRNQPMRLQEVDHFFLTTFVGLQECLLVRGDVLTPRGIRIGERRIRKECLQGAITSQLRLAQHFNVSSLER